MLPLSRAQSGEGAEKRRGGLWEWLTGSFRLDGRSILRGGEEELLCQRDVVLQNRQGGGHTILQVVF